MSFSANAKRRSRHVLDRSRSKKRGAKGSQDTEIELDEAEIENEDESNDHNDSGSESIVQAVESAPKPKGSQGQVRRGRSSTTNMSEIKNDHLIRAAGKGRRLSTTKDTGQLPKQKESTATRRSLRTKTKTRINNSTYNDDDDDDENEQDTVAYKKSDTKIKGRTESVNENKKSILDDEDSEGNEAAKSSNLSQQATVRKQGRGKMMIQDIRSSDEEGKSERKNDVAIASRGLRKMAQAKAAADDDYSEDEGNHNSLEDSLDGISNSMVDKNSRKGRQAKTSSRSKATKRSKTDDGDSLELKGAKTSSLSAVGKKAKGRKSRAVAKDINRSEDEELIVKSDADEERPSRSHRSKLKSTPSRRSPRKSNGRLSHKLVKSSDDEISSDEGDNGDASYNGSDVPSDSGYKVKVQPARKNWKRRSPGSRKVRNGISRSRAHDDDEESIATSNAEEKRLSRPRGSETTPSKSSPRKSKGRSNRESLNRSNDESDSDELDNGNEASDSDVQEKSRFSRKNEKRPTKRKRTAQTRIRSAHASDDDDDDQFDLSSALGVKKPPRTTRSSPKEKDLTRNFRRRAKRTRVSHLADSSESEDLPSSKRRKKSASDDEFVDEQGDDDEDDLESVFLPTEEGSETSASRSFLDQDDSSEHQENLRNPGQRPKSSHVDDVHLTVESSSDDDVFDKTPQRKKRGAKEDSPTPRKKDESDGTADDKQQKRRPISCPSESDAITLDQLPSKHVCCIAPDGQSRQCFALETLHKIALTSAIVTFRDSFDGKQNFLQPPHFRAPMSDDLLDQIASRFGREALDLHGDFYKRSSANQEDFEESDSDDYFVNYTEALMDDEAFVETFRRYVSNTMGSQDIYACPLCYTEAHRQMRGPNQGDDKDNKTPSFLNFVHDPMSILGYLDNDNFAMASTFCFTKAAEIKRHLREDHGVDTQAVEGNELYSRFKVRGQGGLLQTYINKRSRRSRQGDMMRYWMEGNNQSFLLLLSQIRLREAYWRILFNEEEDDENSEENDRIAQTPREKANLLWDEANAFIESLSGRDKKVWSILSAPFSKVTQEELDEFIADGDGDHEEEVDPTAYHRAMMEKEEQDLEAKMIEHLRNKRNKYGDNEGSGNDDDDADSNDDDDADSNDDNGSGVLEDSESDVNQVMLQGYYSEVSEQDEDDWLHRRRPVPRAKRKKSSHITIELPSSPVRRKRLGQGRKRTPSKTGSVQTPITLTNESPASSARPASVAKGKRVINDSDDDELDFIGATPGSTGPASAAKAKSVILDSDEES